MCTLKRNAFLCDVFKFHRNWRFPFRPGALNRAMENVWGWRKTSRSVQHAEICTRIQTDRQKGRQTGTADDWWLGDGVRRHLASVRQRDLNIVASFHHGFSVSSAAAMVVSAVPAAVVRCIRGYIRSRLKTCTCQRSSPCFHLVPLIAALWGQVGMPGGGPEDYKTCSLQRYLGF